MGATRKAAHARVGGVPRTAELERVGGREQEGAVGGHCVRKLVAQARCSSAGRQAPHATRAGGVGECGMREATGARRRAQGLGGGARQWCFRPQADGLGPVPRVIVCVSGHLGSTGGQPGAVLVEELRNSCFQSKLPFREARPPGRHFHATCAPTALIFSAFGAQRAPASSRGVGGAKIATGEIRTLACNAHQLFACAGGGSRVPALAG